MKWYWKLILFLPLFWFLPKTASGNTGGGSSSSEKEESRWIPFGELSFMGMYTKTNFGGGAYTTTRRYTLTVAVYLTSTSEVEASYNYTDTFFNYDPIQTISINEQTLALSLIQALVPRQWIVQPYGKVGAAQYNRMQSGTTDGRPTTPTSSKSPSMILGGGVRIFFLRNFSLKVEAVTFLPDLQFSQASNNFSVQGGVGWNF